jgi:hypothetical protein
MLPTRDHIPTQDVNACLATPSRAIYSSSSALPPITHDKLVLVTVARRKSVEQGPPK